MPTSVSITCRDGYALSAQLWQPFGEPRGAVIVSSATGVLARYYAPYARFLGDHGYQVLTYDYRGIGGSRPASLRGADIRWRDWGDLDFDAVVRWMRQRNPDGPLIAVGHSIGGFLPGFASAATEVDRFLSVGAQYAFWRDYAPTHRWRMFVRWHLFMPAMTALCGYFPVEGWAGWKICRPVSRANGRSDGQRWSRAIRHTRKTRCFDVSPPFAHRSWR